MSGAPVERIYFAANNGDVGGGEVMLLAMAEAARDLGRDAIVVAPAGSAVLAAADDASLGTVGIKGSGRRAYIANLRAWDATARDGLIWCNGLVPAVATAGRRRRVVHVHLMPTGRNLAAFRIARIGADRVVVPSDFVASRIPNSEVLPNWTTRIDATPEPPGRVPATVGFIGRPSVAKGVVVLAEAVAILNRRDAAVRLLIAGAPHFVPAKEQAMVDAALARLGTSVKRAGWMDKADFFSGVDLAVFPSLAEETFGLVVAEAMSARVRFVISDVGALAEVAGPDHPWVVPAGNAARLAETINAALDDWGAEHLDRARDRWERLYSPEAGRERLAALLLHLS